jgi:beta-glucanase (GH16 family)
VDDQPYFTVTPASLPHDARWVFNQPKFLLLNLAVGGAWPGNPDQTTIFPQRMLVDYVRVYTKPDLRNR